MGMIKLRPLTESKPLNRLQKKLCTIDYVHETNTLPKVSANRP